MTGSYYCAGDLCRKTTDRLTVRMQDETYLYCVECSRRLELRPEYDPTQGSKTNHPEPPQDPTTLPARFSPKGKDDLEEKA